MQAKHRPIFHFLSAFSVAFIAGISTPLSVTAADETRDELEEVVVQALRLPTTLSDTGTSVWIVDESLIKARGYLQMTDVLTTAPGVTINQNGTFGGQASARIRGASSDQTMVLVDGIVVNDVSSPGGGFNFGILDVSDVERVEVLKGPQSTLWGSDAIGGVINIVSKTPDAGLNGDISATGGSFGMQQYRVALSGSNDTGDFRVSYNDISTDGISKADEADGNSETDGYDSKTLSVKGGVNLAENARLQLNYRGSDTRTEFDSFGAITGVQDGDEVSDVDFQTAQVSLTFALFDDRLQNMLKYGDTTVDRANFSSGAASFSAEGKRQVLQYQGILTLNDAHQLSFGVEEEDTDNGTTEFANTGLYALYQFQAIEDVTVSLGVRRDDNDAYGNKTVGRLSAVWALTGDLDLRASWGEGFKAPTIFQTTFFCCGASAPNSNLEAEESEAFDIGFDWRLPNGKGSLSASAFRQDTTNLINFSFAIGGYENISEVESTGIELALDYRFADTLSASANVTYIDSQDDNGQRLERLPELTSDLALTWQPLASLTSTLSAVYNSDEEDSRGTVASWLRLDLAANYSFNEHVEMFARIENLSDENYQQIYGYGTPERSAYVGVSYTF